MNDSDSSAKIPFNLKARQSDEKPAPTFGKKRAEQLQERLKKAIEKRRKLKAVEYAGEEPAKTTATERGNMLERSITRMQETQKPANEDDE